MSANDTAAAQLLSFVQRIERLEEEKAALAADIKDVKAEAKDAGFVVKIINKMVKERARDQADLEEERALEDIYRAALGGLGETPLGAAAIRRLSKKPKPAEDPKAPPPGGAAAPDDAAAAPDAPPAAPPAPSEPSEAEIEAAREEGRKAAGDGKPVTANPHPASTRLRAGWDEGWCQAQGSDGMEIPEAWRRPAKPKKGDATPPAEAAAAEAATAESEQRPQP